MALIRTVTLFFTGSVILGAGISWGVDYYEAKAYGDIERDIRKVETSRMNSRLEELSKSRVGLVQK